MLGRLERHWGDNAIYVHLTRDRDATARSFAARASRGIMRAYQKDVILQSSRTRNTSDAESFALDYIDTVTENIEMFLSRRKTHMHMKLENAEEDYARFWDWAGLEGNREAAIASWKLRYNATPKSAF